LHDTKINHLVNKFDHALRANTEKDIEKMRCEIMGKESGQPSATSEASTAALQRADIQVGARLSATIRAAPEQTTTGQLAGRARSSVTASRIKLALA
jgi:hypothetical protein